MIKKEIINKILKNKKSISIEQYIKICLYGNNGYYKNANVIGKKGDYITAPEISQLFGDLIGLFIFSVWKNKINNPYNLIELGPGKGTLLIDILNITKNFSKFQKSTYVNLIETNVNLIDEQKKNIQNFKFSNKKIIWLDDFNTKITKPAIIFANEFFDCLPIRQFYRKNNKWFEKMINFNQQNKNFFFEDKETSHKKLSNYVENNDEINNLEISKSRDKYFNKICKHLRIVGGMAIIVDYGYFNKPNYLTLQSLYNNKRSNVLDNPGKQDITSLVDFKQLIKITKKNKLNVDIFCNQNKFLLMNGIKERAKKIYKKSTINQKHAIKNGLERLIDKDGMGSLFKVLVISK